MQLLIVVFPGNFLLFSLLGNPKYDFQVDNCKNCPWGIKEGTYCQDEDGGVLDPYTAVRRSAAVVLRLCCYSPI